MPIYVVITKDPTSKVSERLAAYNPLKIGPAAHLVVAPDDVLASTIAVKAGIKGENRDLSGGVVLGLNEAYSGWHQSDVWEWLRRYTSS